MPTCCDPDADGRVDERLDKAMYVSPFNPVDGHYRIAVSEPASGYRVSVTLDRDGPTALRGDAARHSPATPQRGRRGGHHRRDVGCGSAR